MHETISEFDCPPAQACPAMAWHRLRAESTNPLSEADRFRMEQGQEIGALARELYPEGILVTGQSGKSAAEITQDLAAHTCNEILFEATFRPGKFVAKADILRREPSGWHVLEVKSRFSDSGNAGELIDDLAYTVMVLQRAGLRVHKASLVLLSRDFRFGGGPKQLFDI